MKTRTRHLKIKVKNLAAEASIIKLEESKTYGDTRYDLQQHRKDVVRRVARLNHLAYGFLRGRSYHQMEKTCLYPPDFHAVEGIALRFGADPEEISGWIAEAREYLKRNP